MGAQMCGEWEGAKTMEEQHKKSVYLIIVLWIVYMCIMFARANYTASVAYIVGRGIFSKSESGFIASSFYVFYSIGQIVGGRLVDKFMPKRMITLGLVGAAVTSMMLCFSTNYTYVLVVWTLNGCMQFGVWPGISRMIAKDIIPQYKEKACFYLSYAAPMGNLISYFLATFLLETYGWSAMFAVSSIILFATLIFWKQMEKHASNERFPKHTKVEIKGRVKVYVPFSKVFLSSGLAFMLVPSFCRCLLLFGMTSWAPTMLMESYQIPSGIASLQTLILLAIQIIGLIVLAPLMKKISNPIIGHLVLASACVIPLCVLCSVGKIPMALAFVMLALALIFANSMFVFMTEYSILFEPLGQTGLVSGIINAIASVGVVFANGLFGILSERFGWNTVVNVWVIFAIITILFAVVAYFYNKRFWQGISCH